MLLVVVVTVVNTYLPPFAIASEAVV